MSKGMTAATIVFVWFVGLAAVVFMAWSSKQERARDERELASEERDRKREARELARETREADERDAAVPRHGAVLSQTSSNAFRAEITVTNPSANEVLYVCGEAIVTHKKTNLQARSVEVCTGPLRPHSTITLEAPYPTGAVEHLCTDGSGSFTWDACNFEVVRAP